MIDKAIEEFKHQFCDWNKPSIFVNSKTQPKMDFLRKKLEEMREACAKEAQILKEDCQLPNFEEDDSNSGYVDACIDIAEAIRKVE